MVIKMKLKNVMSRLKEKWQEFQIRKISSKKVSCQHQLKNW